MLEPARDPELLGISGLAEEDVGVIWRSSTGAVCAFEIWRRGSRPTIFRSDHGRSLRCADPPIPLDRGCKTQRPRAEKTARVVFHPRIVCFPSRRPRLNKFPAGRKLNDQALQKRRGGTVAKRRVPFPLQFVAAASNGTAVDIGHGLE